jgi:predicted methyltransferase
MNVHRLFVWAVLLLCVPAAALADASADLAKALKNDERSTEDRARDAGRQPAQVIAFLGIGPGDKVIDLIAAGGYYTEVLSLAVGEKGTVYAQNPINVLRYRDGAADEQLTARLAHDRLKNVKRLDMDLASVPIEAGTLDAAITALNLHDIYNSRGEKAAGAFLRLVYHLLKPGGVLGVIDHAGKEGVDNKALHRIEESKVRALVEASRFELEASSDLLRNPEDDHTRSVFDPEIRGQTDRFLLKLRKPAK